MGIGQSVDDAYFQQKVKLGQGGFGTVYRAVDRSTNEFVAVKQIDKLQSYWQGAKRSEIQLEIDILRTCDHSNITKLHNYFEDRQGISIVIEYCDGGDLDDKLKERGWQVQEPEAAAWTRQICSAIAHLHAKGICHRDIKPGNFMLAQGVLKLSDFGFAIFLAKGATTTEDVGTPAYMAPEQQDLKKGKGYGHPVDVWAAGCTMHMLVSGGRHPFVKLTNGKKTLDMAKLHSGSLDFGVSMLGGLMGSTFQQASPQARSLCHRMVCPDAEKRLTAEQVLQDPWLKGAPDDAALVHARMSDNKGHAEHFQKLQRQLAAAEKQLKEAEERELTLKSRLHGQDDSVMIVTIPLTLPECMKRCYSCTSCTKAAPAQRIDRERVLK
mmetsp:Transcript_55226/g.103533  ORF Transcript_55226/g.103533 Transcript_55226/m.103533 type:complete len:381 (-) Transcript_55226:118-1260(-)